MMGRGQAVPPCLNSDDDAEEMARKREAIVKGRDTHEEECNR